MNIADNDYSMANHEMRLILAKVLWSFDLEPSRQQQGDWLDQNVYLTWEKTPLMVKVKAAER